MVGHHILLTGPPGVGKTTVIRNTCELLKSNNRKFQGFYTEEVRNGKERIGFDVVTTSGNHAILARLWESGVKDRPRVGKYAVDVSSFETLAIPVFDCAPPTVLILDEIGKMELFSRSFLEKAQQAFAKTNIRILATIPIFRNALPFVDELRNRKDCNLIQVTRENRNNLPKEIAEQLMKIN